MNNMRQHGTANGWPAIRVGTPAPVRKTVIVLYNATMALWYKCDVPKLNPVLLIYTPPTHRPYSFMHHASQKPRNIGIVQQFATANPLLND